MKQLDRTHVVVLGAGAVFAWFTVVVDFVRFYGVEGTIFRVQDCVFPNPVTTPCFWGAWAFLIALVWAITLYKKNGDERRLRQRMWLVVFLVAGTIFAWVNSARDLIAFYTNDGEPTIGCSGQLVTNPFITPCFWGATIFLVCLILGVIAWRSRLSEKPRPDQESAS